MATPKGIREYLKINNESMDPSSWLNKTEIPSPAEISGAGSTGADEGEIEIPVNRVIGAWETKAAYLSSHYTLLREDAIAPLRNVVSELRAEPHIMENESQEQASIYEKVILPLIYL